MTPQTINVAPMTIAIASGIRLGFAPPDIAHLAKCFSNKLDDVPAVSHLPLTSKRDAETFCEGFSAPGV
jgi:hypothetical protein